jgi:hypothetical protein
MNKMKESQTKGRNSIFQVMRFLFFRIILCWMKRRKKDDDSHYDPGLPFTSRRIGVNVNVNRFPVEMSAMKIFFELFTHKLERNLIDATNCFGKKHYGSAWTPLSHMEFFSFRMVVMHMGIVRRDDRDDYWGEGCFRDLFVTSVFPKQERFNQIFFALHVRSDDSFTAEEKRKDPFIKVRPLLTELCASFSAAFFPEQALSIDEQTIAFKGRHKAKQYNKQKPHRWGFRKFAASLPLIESIERFY